MNVGERIKRLRKERNLTQEELGSRMGLLPSNVARYENGRNEPRKAMLARFAEAFGLTPQELLTEALVVQDDLAAADPEMASLFREIITLSEGDRAAVKRVLTLVIKQNRIQQVIAS
jgi:transcriptional regulator with XRE-family HTH domain